MQRIRLGFLVLLSVLSMSTYVYALKGDMDNNGIVDLKDVILSLQVISGKSVTASLLADINGDGKLGNEESVYALQSVSKSVESDADYTNSLGMKFNLLPAGTFTMGSPEDELGREYDNPRRILETQHEVTLTLGFYMQTTEVTQGQWEAVMLSNPSHFQYMTAPCPTCPVENVSWYQVQQFIAAMNARGEGTYDLPTEAQWEYAARAGSTSAFANGEITAPFNGEYDPNLDAIGWYSYNNGDHYTVAYGTKPVALKAPNAWGLYDMHGNVFELCKDRLVEKLWSLPVTDPFHPVRSVFDSAVVRGGSWSCWTHAARSAYRAGTNPSSGHEYAGFRLVLLPGQ